MDDDDDDYGMTMMCWHPCGQNSMIPIPACGRYQTTSVWIIQDDDENKRRGEDVGLPQSLQVKEKIAASATPLVFIH